MAISPDQIDRIAAANAAAPTVTDTVVPGSAQDPFYQSTGQYKNVTLPDGTVVRALDVTTTKPPAATEVGMISPSSGLAITGTERNMYNERQALNQGYTPEYIASRGGINSQGYFNDTPLTGQLTAAEYKSVTKPDGTIDSQKMLAILNAKGGGQGNIFGPGGAGGAGGAGGMGGAAGTSTMGGPGTPEQQAARKSAYDLLFEQFNQYGLGGLVTPLKSLIMENVSPSEFTLRLRETDAYKKRFAANAQRIAKGLRPLDESTYIGLEDQYQEIMRNYGLPESYYARGDMGRQQGFEKLIANDVSNVELEDRLQTAYNRVINAAPEISQALKNFYPDINNGDILAYALDPEQGLNNIKRKVTAAEIGGAANIAGLNKITSESTPEEIAAFRQRAEELARYGITGEAARQGYQAVAEVLPRGTQLAEFYKQAPYTQKSAEQEVFNLAGGTEYARERKKLSQLEQASFAGQAGIAGGALTRERAGSF